MAMFIHRFKVSGKVAFPVDMLRYDACFPRSSSDAGKIVNTFDSQYLRDVRNEGDGMVTVELVAYRPNKTYIPTVGRWNSFLWSVHDHQIERAIT